MKKSLKIIGLCLWAILIVVGIYASLSPKTFDFRGTVTKIKNADGNTFFHLSSNKAAYTVEGNYRRFSKENIASL